MKVTCRHYWFRDMKSMTQIKLFRITLEVPMIYIFLREISMKNEVDKEHVLIIDGGLQLLRHTNKIR